MNSLIAQLRELEVTEKPSEVVDAFLREDRLDEVVAVTHEDHGQDLDHDDCHVPAQRHRHLCDTMAQKFLLIGLREFGEKCISAIWVVRLNLLSVWLQRVLEGRADLTWSPERRRLHQLDLRFHITPPVEEVCEDVTEPRFLELLANIRLFLRTHTMYGWMYFEIKNFIMRLQIF